MRKAFIGLALTLGCTAWFVFGLWVFAPRPVTAQRPDSLVYGNSSGTIVPLAVTSTGAVVLGTGSATVGTVNLSTTDPCLAPNVSKVAVVIAATADAELVAINGSELIYVCGWSVTVAGTAPTYRLISGTGTTCATGTVGETGVYATLANAESDGPNYGGTVLAGAAGAALCIDVGGTTPSIQGVLSYVQQ